MKIQLSGDKPRSLDDIFHSIFTLTWLTLNFEKLEILQIFSECKDLMKVQLCLNVIDFCDVFLVANYCCESCRTESFRRPPPISASHNTADGGNQGGHKTSYTRIPRVRRVSSGVNILTFLTNS